MVVLLSIERLVAVYMPHKVKVIFSAGKVKVIIAIIMGLLVTWNVAFHYTKTLEEEITQAHKSADDDDKTHIENDTTDATLKVRNMPNQRGNKGHSYVRAIPFEILRGSLGQTISKRGVGVGVANKNMQERFKQPS